MAMAGRFTRVVHQHATRFANTRSASTATAEPEPGLKIFHYLIPVLAAPVLYMYLNGDVAIPEYIKATQQPPEERRAKMNEHLVHAKIVADKALARAQLPSRYGPSGSPELLAHSSGTNVGFSKE
eukprot:m.17535 g.17535  ORF g.17535 m.17535 type:complete len:125 (-) comp11548_c0_seq1:195-569(-)